MTNEQLIQTAKEAMRNDTVLNKGIVELLCNALEKSDAQLHAVVAENAALKGNINKLENWPGLEFYSSAWEFNKSDGFDASELICDIETTATDAAIASLRAEGVEMAIQHLHSKFEGTGRIGVPVMTLEHLAAQLRQSVQVNGVQS